MSAGDFEALNRWRWSLLPNGYAHRGTLRDGKPMTVLMHRQILGLEYGDRRQGDHLNFDRLDNSRSNLRVVPNIGAQLQNQPSRGSSRYRGVRFYPQTGRWQARVQIDRKQHHIGYFATERQAADAAASFRRQHMPYATD